jgi:hypothetical protein
LTSFSWRPAVIVFITAVVLLTVRAVHATTVLDLALDAQVSQATAIVKGQVTSVEALLVNGSPYNEIVFSVDEWIKGSGPSLISFRVIGGALPDGRILRVEGAPRFAVGQTLCLLLTPSTAIPIVGVYKGYYRLDGQQQRVFDHAQHAVSHVQRDGRLYRSSRPDEAMAWPAFRDVLRQSVQKQK